jgi:preprotein translocase subunit SecE
MARNRQRAKDRKQKLHRENIPGSLDHASGDVEEVEAAIVAGGEGTPVAADDAVEPDDAVEADHVVAVDDAVEPEVVEPDAVIAPDDAPDVEPEPELAPAPKRRRGRRPAAAKPVEPVGPVEPDGDDDDDLDAEPASAGQLDATAEAVEHRRLGRGAGDVVAAPHAGRPAGFRALNFFRACWAELQRVDWPDRRQVGQATAVVLGFVVVAGAFLGLADVVAQRLVDLIL